MNLTLDDFPEWSVWMRDYADKPAASEDHWVLFVIERHEREHGEPEMECRVIATAVPLSTPSGTLAPGKTFFVKPSSAFAALVKRVA